MFELFMADMTSHCFF